jgi:hypothetical protein
VLAVKIHIFVSFKFFFKEGQFSMNRMIIRMSTLCVCVCVCVCVI